LTDSKPINAITHEGLRANIPPAELEPVLDDEKPIKFADRQRNPTSTHSSSGVEASAKVRDPDRPSNALIERGTARREA
jgi:hypothetical protein